MALLSNLLMDAGQPVVTKYNTLVQATTGYLPISVAGSADVTLTNNQVSHAVLELTGALTGNIVVFVPTREKLWVVYNNTSGAFSVTFKPTSGSGPVLTQGAHTTVYCTGANVIQIGAAVSGAGAPTDAQYMVAATHATLSAERVATDTATVAWDFSVGGQAKADVPNDAITYAKLQNASATARILARITAGAGNYEEASITEVLDLIGGVAQGDILYRGAANWAVRAAGTAGQFLMTQGPGANPIWDTPAGGGGGAPDSAQYLVAAANAALTAERVMTDTATVAWDFATAAQAKATVPDNSITYARLQNASATARILARITAGAGDYEEATLTQVLDLVGSPAQGDILYRGVANWNRLGAGVSGEFLMTQGPGANPIWDSPAGGGGGAPETAQYLVSAANAGLTAERVMTDTATINWDFATAAQAKANVANNSVTYAKLQDASDTERILARKSAGAGSYEEATLTQILDFIGGATQGDLLYRGPLQWARLPAGNSGEFLKTLGAGDNPMWDTPAGAGGGAPDSAQYLVSAAHASLIAERVMTDTATIAWDFATAAQAKANVPAGSITYAKLQDASAAERILARKTAGAGSYEEATISQVLDFLGSVAQGDVLYRGPAQWARLGAGSSGQYLKTQGAGANPTWATVAAGAPDSAQYLVAAANASLTAERVMTDTATIVWDFATAAQAKADVPNDAITYAKLQNASATSRILARVTAAAGNYEEATITQVLDMVGGVAQGDILYRGAAAWAVRPAGTSGQFLQTQGAGANPVWATPAAGAPTDAGYFVASNVAGLSSERAVLDTATINWNYGTPGEVTAGIIDGSVTYAKLQNASVTERILARRTAGAGSYEEATLTQILDFIGSSVAQGDILYRGATTWGRLQAGTSGDFLKTQGTGANPVWDSSAGGTLANGQEMKFPPPLTELTTIAAAATTTTSIAIPPGAIVFGVSVRVTVTIPTATTFSIGVSGATTRYGGGLSTAAGTTNRGTSDPLQYGPSTAIIITPNVTPGTNAGRIRVSIHYLNITPPTS